MRQGLWISRNLVGEGTSSMRDQKGRYVSGDRSPEFKEMQRQGLSAAQIADRMGVTQRTVTRWRKNAGLTQPLPENVGRPVAGERLDAAAEMLADGAPYQEVCRTLRMNGRTVRKYFPGISWSKEEAGQFAAQIHRIKSEARRNAA